MNYIAWTKPDGTFHIPRTPLPEVKYLSPIEGLLAWVEAGGAL